MAPQSHLPIVDEKKLNTEIILLERQAFTAYRPASSGPREKFSPMKLLLKKLSFII